MPTDPATTCRGCGNTVHPQLRKIVLNGVIIRCDRCPKEGSEPRVPYSLSQPDMKLLKALRISPC